jgi:hypothetical protein
MPTRSFFLSGWLLAARTAGACGVLAVSSGTSDKTGEHSFTGM